MSSNALTNTPLAHHEAGNEWCPSCDRSELAYPVPCHCGGLVHRDGESSDYSEERYMDICDQCGGKQIDELI